MSVYVLKAHEPHPRDPDITRRDPDPDPLDRLKISVHGSLEAAKAAAQKSFEVAYGDGNPIPDDYADEDDAHIMLDWDDRLWVVDDTYECEYAIVEFAGFEPADPAPQPA